MRSSRRQLLKLALLAGVTPDALFANADDAAAQLYAVPAYGDLRLLHITDTHAQLLPVHYREPNVNLGVGAARGQVPHLVGHALLDHFRIPAATRRAHATTFLDYVPAARRFGRLGGYAHLKTLVDRLRGTARASLLLDGGDTWQGSATALWTQGADMVEASNRLGVDCMTGHWEFTYPEAVIQRNLAAFHGEFLAANVFVADDAVFEGVTPHDAQGHVFAPYAIKTLHGQRVAVIGQAFPYVDIAHPRRFTPQWTYGIHEQRLQRLIDDIRTREKPALVVLLSHNGMDTDLKLASRVRGIDIILGGHTHDAVPAPSVVSNSGGRTLVTNAGTNGKFVGVMDVKLGAHGLAGWRYELLPVFADLLPPEASLAGWIETVRKPYAQRLAAPLAATESLLYRRGNFNGTMDQVICDALRHVAGAELSFSPGFRWGTTVLPGAQVTFEDVMQHTAITYPATHVTTLTGAQIKARMEDVCDNLFNPDPYYQQGGDMMRVGGLDYSCDPTARPGSRINDLVLDNGKPLDASRKYRVASWAPLEEAEGRPVWDVVSEYLRAEKTVRVRHLNQPRLRHALGNPGVADYGVAPA